MYGECVKFNRDFVECMELVELPISVSDGFPEVKRIAAWIGTVPGGQGAVREVCDWMANILQGS